MSNDRLKIKISRIDKGDRGRASAETTTWAKLMDLLGKPIIDKRRTQAEYAALDADGKAKVKDVGSYVPGVFRAGIRRTVNLIERTAITLDIDHLIPRQVDAIMDGLTPLSDYEFFASTTRSHTPGDPRWRIVLPLTRPLAPEEYGPLARIIASKLLKDAAKSMDAVDPVSFRAAQVMYLPSRSKDGKFDSIHNRGDLIDPDEILDGWGDWQDFANLPYSEKRGIGNERIGHKAQDPTAKRGVVGAFCRTYTVQEAIDEFLSDVYKPSRKSGQKPRYTYTGGSGTNGVVVEDDGRFIYSHHGTDPCGGRLFNAFDMVRLHMFANADEGYGEDGYPTALPSYKAMSKLARSIEGVAKDIADQQSQAIINEFTDDDDDEVEAGIGHNGGPVLDLADEFETIPFDEYPERFRRTRKHPLLADIPDHLLTIPGKLGLAVKLHNSVSIKPQPQFAVQTALFIGSLILARNYRSSRNNYTSLYLVNVVESSSGKDASSDVIEAVFEGAGLGDLLGGGDFTSDSALESRLEYAPKTGLIIDEISHVIKGMKSGDSVKASAEKVILTCFSSVSKNYRPKMFSMNGKTEEQKKAAHGRLIKRPALTILGMTTPDAFIDALGEADIANGFINRMLPVESPIILELPGKAKEVVPPRELIEWCVRWADEATDDDDMKKLKLLGRPQDAPEPKPMVFTDKADRRIDELNIEIVRAQRDLYEHGLHPLLGRTMEIGQRLSMIIAASCESRTIEVEHLQWGYDYARFYHDRLIEKVRTRLGVSKNAILTQELADYITSFKEEGISPSMLVNNKRKFNALPQHEYREVLERLKTHHGIILHTSEGGKGRNKTRYVAPKYVQKFLNG